MKPVAYIDRQDLELLPHQDCWVNGQEHKNSVPLYIHPAKTLTDEEIFSIADDYEIADYRACKFAKAILKKANEK
jgi:hypothetical protein